MKSRSKGPETEEKCRGGAEDKQKGLSKLLNRLKDGIENFAEVVVSRRTIKATAAALAVSIAIASCGDETSENRDAEPDAIHDVEDVHETPDAEVGPPDEASLPDEVEEDVVEDALPNLCETYPEGDEHRHTFPLEHYCRVLGDTRPLLFVGQGITSADRRAANFLLLNPLDGDAVSIPLHVPRSGDFGGPAPTIIEFCTHNTDDECSSRPHVSGNQECTVTIAADRIWEVY